MPKIEPKFGTADLKRFRNLLIATAAMVYLLIVIGGIVRVTGSGLGCPDWPRCFGNWIPPLRADAIIEYTHRLVATLTSPLILTSAAIAWWRYRAIKLISRNLLAAIILLAVQGLLGGIVVILETPPNLVAVHLGIAFIIQALVSLPAVLLANSVNLDVLKAKMIFSTPFEKLSRQTLILVFVMIVSGAIVVGSNSTYACSGWPLCNGQLIPNNPNAYFHMVHRLMVLITSVFIVRVYLSTRRQFSPDNNVRKVASIAFFIFITQVGVGALKVSFGFPILLLGLHVALASALWLSIVIFTSLVGLQKKAS
jgi:heme A synthase